MVRIKIIILFVLGILVGICLCILYAFLIEPKWVKIKNVDLSNNSPSIRLIHISDIHYKGDKPYLEKVVKLINKIDADFVCFTGDLIEEEQFQKESLEILSNVNKPIFSIPGNHDYWSKAPINLMDVYFKKTGGRLLLNEIVELKEKNALIIGVNEFSSSFVNNIQPDLINNKKTILLVHYPDFANEIKNKKFSIILAGHSHGGQVNIPFLNPYIPRYYQKGLYKTESGYLYVNPGLGTFLYPIRFNCRPEITVISL